MNNGVNENQGNNTILAPMEGVKIAPVMEGNPPAPIIEPQPVIQNSEPVMVSAPIGTPVVSQPVVSRLEATSVPIPQEVPVEQPVSPPVAPTTPTPVSTPTKKKVSLLPILLVLLLLLVGYTIFSMKMHNDQIRSIQYSCTPISMEGEQELSLDSTLVEELYKKVSTNIREDYASSEMNAEMKLYLAYRQILETDKYDTTCTQFNVVSMEPFVCEGVTNFTPKGFKEETLLLEMKKLYGEGMEIPLGNIQLGSSCIGGYQYIPQRKEFVEGYCNQKTAVSFKATKNLVKAVSYGNTIVLTEEVKYHESEGMELPSYLKSGEYRYVFRLDKNYHYVFVNKEYVNKY